jgi:hypothetical protein
MRISLLKTSTFFLVIFLTTVSIIQTKAQVFSDKIVQKKQADLADSLKNVEYPYLLPIWGSKVVKKGFDLPYSAGINVNYFWQRSDLAINNLSIGFNGGPKYNIDEIVRIPRANSESNAISFRPDVWVLPFLNLYGIFAASNTSTSIDATVNIPDSNSWKEIGSFSTTAHFDATTVGFGITPTIGVAGGWMALDMNFTWSDIDKLDDAVYNFVFDPRIGKAFRLKGQQAVAVWVGGFRVQIESATSGSIPLGDLFSTENLETKINNGLAKIDESQQQVDAWWNGLTNLEQNNPVNIAKYETANRALDLAGNVYTNFSDAVGRIETSTVQYSLDKKMVALWHIIVGSQYQLNKHWMIRAEYGFVSARHTFLGGLQYRFGL